MVNITIDKWIKELSKILVSDAEAISVKEYEKHIAELEMENEIKKSYRHISKKMIEEIVIFIEIYKKIYTVKRIGN